MTEEQKEAMIRAVDKARINLFRDHCMRDQEMPFAVSHLASQFMLQAWTCLNAVYNGDQKLVNAHILLLLPTLVEQPAPIRIE